MRLKENSTSYRARGIIRRDMRQQKPPDDFRHSPGKKDTKRWCGGKVGREHKPVCMRYDDLQGRKREGGISARWRVLVCDGCGKRLAHYFPWGRRSKNPKPSWVTN